MADRDMIALNALYRIVDMDPEGIRADDLGRAARIASDALNALKEPDAAAMKADPVAHGLPPYPTGEVVGPCVCGGWPGGKCLHCEVIPAKADERGSAEPVAVMLEAGVRFYSEEDMRALPRGTQLYVHPDSAQARDAAQAVELTDADIRAFAKSCGAFDAGDIRGLILWENMGVSGSGLVGLARAIERAVLAKNGLGGKQ